MKLTPLSIASASICGVVGIVSFTVYALFSHGILAPLTLIGFSGLIVLGLFSMIFLEVDRRRLVGGRTKANLGFTLAE